MNDINRSSHFPPPQAECLPAGGRGLGEGR